jgi:hypothetical protein
MVVYVKFLHGVPAPTSVRYMKYVHCVIEGFLCMVCLQFMLSVVLTGSVAVLIAVISSFSPVEHKFQLCPTCLE